MSALFAKLAMPSTAFTLDDIFHNLSKFGQRWGFDIVAVVGAVLMVVGGVQFVKALHSQQGAGRHYFRAAVGLVIGAILMFGAPALEHMLDGPQLFSNLTNGNGFIVNMLTVMPLHTLIHINWLHLLL